MIQKEKPKISLVNDTYDTLFCSDKLRMQFWLRDRKDGRIIRLISFDYFTASLCIVTHDETRFINIHLNASCLLLSPSFNMFLSKKIWSVVKRRVIHLTAAAGVILWIRSCSLRNANCFHLNDLIK